jgi:hypothetical protein
MSRLENNIPGACSRPSSLAWHACPGRHRLMDKPRYKVRDVREPVSQPFPVGLSLPHIQATESDHKAFEM